MRDLILLYHKTLHAAVAVYDIIAKQINKDHIKLEILLLIFLHVSAL